MAYKELIKNFSKIRSYLKEFFVYGYNARGSVGQKSDRSYDDEKRRIKSIFLIMLKNPTARTEKLLHLALMFETSALIRFTVPGNRPALLTKTLPFILF